MSDTIPAPHRIYSEPTTSGTRTLLYAEGDPVPVEVAGRLGLVDTPKATAPAKKAPARKRAKKGPVEDRSARPGENRGNGVPPEVTDTIGEDG